MQYPVKLIANLGNEVEENLYCNYTSGKISLITDNGILTFPAKTLAMFVKRIGDYIYYTPYTAELPSAVFKIHVPTGEQIKIFEHNELVYGNIDVIQTAIGLLFRLRRNLYHESGEKIPVFVNDCTMESEIVYHNNEILVAMNIIDLTDSIYGCFTVFSFKTNRIIFKTPDYFIKNCYKPGAPMHELCIDVFYSHDRKDRDKWIDDFKKSIKFIGGSTLLFKGSVLELNHDIVAPECYICLQEIYLDPDYRPYKCFHEGYVAHTECLKKTTSCPICRETQRL